MENVTCPFCGLACDDLQVEVVDGSVRPTSNACMASRESYRRLDPVESSPRIAGSAVGFADAVAHAASILKRSRLPLFGGFATDLSGARRVVQLADRCGGVIDHMNSPAKFRNLLAVQDAGWITTTLAEVRNRADLIVMLGTDGVSRFPRFFERVVWAPESMFGLDTGARQIVFVGDGLDARAGMAPSGRMPEIVPCRVEQIGEGLGAMRAMLGGQSIQAPQIAGVATAQWASLLDKLRGASYAVIVWAAPDLAFPHAELAVQTLSGLVKELNKTTRVSGLPLGGSDGDFTANGVLTWQTGFPIRTSFATGVPLYDPHLHSGERLIASGEADALVWISAFSTQRTPPALAVPTVVLAPPAMQFGREPEVFIPVGTPGVDHAGHFTRTDKVVSMPLRKLRDAGVPSVEHVAAAIEAALEGKAD